MAMKYGLYKILDGIEKHYSALPDAEKTAGMQKFFDEVIDKIEDTFFSEEANEEIVVSVGSFLHGFCPHLALRLNKEFGYDMEILYLDKEFSHIYCTVNKDGKKYYIDSRGITDDFDLFCVFFTHGTDMEIKAVEICADEALENMEAMEFVFDGISDAMCDWFIHLFRGIVDIKEALKTVRT